MNVNTVPFDKKQAKVIAHRGVSGLECENSCAAFVAAGNRSYFGIETDVHVTKDGRFIVIHDDRTGRVSDTDISVEGSTFEALSAVRLYSDVKHRTPGRRDLVLPELSDYIRICKRYGKVAVLELKNPMEPDRIDGIVETIRQLEYLDSTVFISFSLENMQHLRRRLPEQKLQFLTGQWTDDLPQLLWNNRLDLDIYYKELTAQRVALLHGMGIEVNCWTCDTPEEAEALAAMGVDYITSNILE